MTTATNQPDPVREFRDRMKTNEIRQELGWLLYGWSRPDGEELPWEMATDDFRLWEVKARGILSLLADKLTAAGHADAAKLLTGQP